MGWWCLQARCEEGMFLYCAAFAVVAVLWLKFKTVTNLRRFHYFILKRWDSGSEKNIDVYSITRQNRERERDLENDIKRDRDNLDREEDVQWLHDESNKPISSSFIWWVISRERELIPWMMSQHYWQLVKNFNSFGYCLW